MKKEDYKGKTADELQKALLDLKKQEFNLRMQLSQGQLENTSQVRVVRRNIARVKTFLSQVEATPAKKKTTKKSAGKAA